MTNVLSTMLLEALEIGSAHHEPDKQGRRTAILEQFAGAGGVEQADVIRYLLSIARSDTDSLYPDTPYADTRYVYWVSQLLATLADHLDLNKCDEWSKQRVRTMVCLADERQGYLVDWKEVARLIEGGTVFLTDSPKEPKKRWFVNARHQEKIISPTGEKQPAPMVPDEEKWKSWFLAEAARHEDVCRKRGQGERSNVSYADTHGGTETHYGSIWLKGGLFCSLEHSRLFKEAGTSGKSPSQFHRELSGRQQAALYEAQKSLIGAIPGLLEQATDNLRKKIDEYEAITRLEGLERLSAYEGVFGVSEEKNQVLKQIQLHQYDVKAELLEKRGL